MNSYMPKEGVEVHPWMPRALHGQATFTERKQQSPLGGVCTDRDLSIHDRERVYNEMKRVEQQMLFGKEVVK